MIKTDVFGMVLGNEGVDYFVVETDEATGNRKCLTSLNKMPLPNVAVCSERIYPKNSLYGNACTKPAKHIRDFKRTVHNHGDAVFEFTLDKNDVVIGRPRLLEETIQVGYCKQHDPECIAARGAKAEEARNAESTRRANAELAVRKHKLIKDAKAINYDHVQKAAQAAIDTFAGVYLTEEQLIALDKLEKQLGRLCQFVAAGDKYYGITSYMVDTDGDLIDRYKV